MLRPGGYAIATDRDGRVHECDTFTCIHCNRVVHVPPKCEPAAAGGWCRMCGKPVCPACEALGRCTPFERRLELMEARYHARRSYTAAAAL